MYGKKYYLSPPLPYVIVLDCWVKTLQVKAIEFHRIKHIQTSMVIAVSQYLSSGCQVEFHGRFAQREKTKWLATFYSASLVMIDKPF